MSLILSEEQEFLRDTVREFVQANAPVTALRALRDSQDPDGFSRELWKEMAELGWVGAALPEDLGGAGLGFAELGIVLEECGRTLAASPYLSTAVLGASALELAGTDAQKKELIPEICSGERVWALAFQEGGQFAPFECATVAESAGDGFRLSGEKLFVLDGHVADTLIVTARSAGGSSDREGIRLFLVDPKAAGVEITRTLMVDSRNAARIRFDAVEVDRSAALGQVGTGAATLDAVLDRAAICLSAEMLGSTQEVFERTLQYLKDRQQFGKPIGSFQALKHRAANLFCEVELSKSIVLDALRALDEGRPGLSLIASSCKARCSDTFVLAANEGVQMFGGIGMTDEEEVGLFLKRAKVAAHCFGDGAYHRNRFAALSGY